MACGWGRFRRLRGECLGWFDSSPASDRADVMVASPEYMR
nr:MAG TPA: hypothetical protein [Caudoviricetes sp.]